MADEKKTSLKDYWNQLAQHDWFYEYSDDPRMYREGRDNNHRLMEIAKHDQKYTDLYHAYAKYVFGAGPQPPCPP